MSLRKAQINVSARIIADISSGIYRTPANALKELISNSFDADADTVFITTNYPEFDIFTISDNGSGMSSTQFSEVMGRIGGSDKRVPIGDTPGFTKLGRPIIGKIGIGVLAVAQICRKFTVISSTIDKPERFEATIDLNPFHEQDAYKLNLPDKRVNIGEYDIYENIEEEVNISYTKIILEEIEQGFRDRLQNKPEKSMDFKFKDKNPKTFEEFTTWMEDKRAHRIPEYLKLLWELAIISPVPYLEKGPILKSKIMESIKQRLLDYNFQVIVDGIKLLKPVKFPYESIAKEKYFDWKTYDISYEDVVSGSNLKFSGYIYHRNRAIWPPELRGLLIRIKNVGIGGYDKTLLNFPASAGLIISSVTGEIYVDAGLEDALNIDRNSFRETDPHYIKLQEIIFNELSKKLREGGILADARARSNKMQDKRREDEIVKNYDSLLNIVNDYFDASFKLELVEDVSHRPVKIDTKKSKIIISKYSPLYPRRKKEKILYEKFILYYELSTVDIPNKSSIDKIFYSLIRKR